MFHTKRFIKICGLIRNQTYYQSHVKVQVSFSPQEKVQFFVKSNSTVQDFKKLIQQHSKLKIHYQVENHTGSLANQNFNTTATQNNLILKTGDKILAYQIKDYENTYNQMPIYNANIFHEFENSIPVNQSINKLKLQFQKPYKPKDELRTIVHQNQKQLQKISKKSLRIPRYFMYGLIAQWISMFGITYGVYDWDVAEPIVYVTSASIDLALLLGYNGINERYQQEIKREKQQVFKNKVSDIQSHKANLYWRMLFMNKKIDSL